jgi:hypothetical protein
MLLLSCSRPEPISPIDDAAPICDGIMQEDEQPYVDGPFDADNDGFPSANVPECTANFVPGDLDCDDDDPTVNPGATEITCNDIDEDCNAGTHDRPDEDGDESSICDGDCDDANGSRSPLLPEICFDDLDNNCDSVIDEACGPNYNGMFAVYPPVVYSCIDLPGSDPVVDVDFGQMFVEYTPPTLKFEESGDGFRPTQMSGEIGIYDTYFFVSDYIDLGTPVDCDEYYQLTGDWISADEFVGTFEIHFDEIDAGGLCLGCTFQTFSITGTRISGP